MTMTDAPHMPREQQKALADLCGFGRLEHFECGFAANELHIPELAHSPAVIDILIRSGYAKRETHPGKGVLPTAIGHRRNKEIFDGRAGT